MSNQEIIDVTGLDDEQIEKVRVLVTKFKDKNIQTLNALEKGKFKELNSVQKQLDEYSCVIDLFYGIKGISSHTTCRTLGLGHDTQTSVGMLIRRLNRKLLKTELDKKGVATAIQILNKLFEEDILQKPEGRPH